MQIQTNEIFLPENLNHLPAARKADELIELMKHNSVIIVEGETGSGKSVVLPTVIAEHYGKDHSRVIVTQNRRLLCENISKFVSESMGYEVGTPVGYHFKGEKKGDFKTHLSFETTGTVLGQLRNNLWLSGIQCIVVDEVHEGAVDQHLLLSHLKRIVESNPNFRIVLMSATLSTENKKRFKSFFNVPVGFLQVEGRSYPVERKFTGHKINCKQPYQRIKNQVILYTVETIMEAYNNVEQGTILAFLPGKAEIAEATRRLSQYGQKPFSLHAETSEEEKAEAIKGNCKGKKIVLCTEVARSGLTVEGVQAVISSGYARIGQVESTKQISGIRTNLTDWASLKQEGGRTGRTCPGIHYIVGDEGTIRPSNPEVAIKTTDITANILNLLATVNDISNFEWFVSPGKKQLTYAFRALEQLGAVKSNEGKGVSQAFETKLTPLGLALSKIPVNPRIGKMLLVAKYLGAEKEGTILASVLINKVRLPYEWSEITGEYSDDMTYITSQREYENDLEAIVTEYENGYFNKLSDGCVTNTVSELLNGLSKVTSQELQTFGFDSFNQPYTSKIDALRLAIISSFGQYAAMYVKDYTILDEVFYEELKGGYFYNASSEDSFKFDTMKSSRYHGHKSDGLILIPLNLFYFENDIKCSIAIDVTMNELEVLSPMQANNLELLHNEIGNYKAPMTGKYSKIELTAEERLFARLFATEVIA